jgi:hypothetical protein
MPNISIKRNNIIYYPLDELNFQFWQGNVTSIQSEPINYFDKRVYIAIYSLYEWKNEYITLGMIHRTMGGNSGSHGKHSNQNIKNSIQKLSSIIIDKENANQFFYLSDANIKLLSCEYVEDAIICGQETKNCLHLLEKPPLIQYDHYDIPEEQAFMLYSVRQFHMPCSLTPLNCAIDDYFRYHISNATNDYKKFLKLQFPPIFEYCQADRQKRNKIRKKVPTFLDFYAEIELIRSYSIKEDAIFIRL